MACQSIFNGQLGSGGKKLELCPTVRRLLVCFAGFPVTMSAKQGENVLHSLANRHISQFWFWCMIRCVFCGSFPRDPDISPLDMWVSG